MKNSIKGTLKEFITVLKITRDSSKRCISVKVRILASEAHKQASLENLLGGSVDSISAQLLIRQRLGSEIRQLVASLELG